MNIECFRETLNTLTVGEIIGENAEYSVNDVCEVLDNIKGILKGQGIKKTQISSNTPQKIMKLYAANFSPEDIADMLNLTVEEVSLVTTTSDNEITSIAQRMYEANMKIPIIADILNVPEGMIKNLFGIASDATFPNGVGVEFEEEGPEIPHPLSDFIAPDIDEQNFEAGYDHTGH